MWDKKQRPEPLFFIERPSGRTFTGDRDDDRGSEVCSHRDTAVFGLKGMLCRLFMTGLASVVHVRHRATLFRADLLRGISSSAACLLRRLLVKT